MLLHPDVQVQSIFTSLETQRDTAIVEASNKTALAATLQARVAELESQIEAITQSTAAAALAVPEAPDDSPAN